MTWRMAACSGGLAAVWIAVASPVAHLDHQLLTAHMVQHLLLMVVAAPFITAGACSATLLRRLRQPHPAICWLAGSVTVVVWHLPAVFEMTLQSPYWHHLEHGTFLAGGILFWWPVIKPMRLGVSPGSWLPLYLFLATLPCDALGAFLTFYDHLVYPAYSPAHAVFGITPLEDQALAGALMWVAATFAYMLPALVLTAQLISGERGRDAGQWALAPRLPGPGSGSGDPRAVPRIADSTSGCMAPPIVVQSGASTATTTASSATSNCHRRASARTSKIPRK